MRNIVFVHVRIKLFRNLLYFFRHKLEPGKQIQFREMAAAFTSFPYQRCKKYSDRER